VIETNRVVPILKCIFEPGTKSWPDVFDPATTSKSRRSNTTGCWRRPRRCIATACPVAVVRDRICETPRPFVFTTRPVRSSQSAASWGSIRRSRIRKPVRSNWPASSATRPSRRFVQPKTNTPAESVSQLGLFAMAKSVEWCSTASLPRRSTSVKPGTASPTWPSPAATRCSQSLTARHKSCGGKTLARRVVSGPWSVSVGLRILCTWSKCRPAASRLDVECELVRRTATCIN
jgi:hypothetical protein